MSIHALLPLCPLTCDACARYWQVWKETDASAPALQNGHLLNGHAWTNGHVPVTVPSGRLQNGQLHNGQVLSAAPFGEGTSPCSPHSPTEPCISPELSGLSGALQVSTASSCHDGHDRHETCYDGRDV